jgi:hypothetical protein
MIPGGIPASAWLGWSQSIHVWREPLDDGVFGVVSDSPGRLHFPHRAGTDRSVPTILPVCRDTWPSVSWPESAWLGVDLAAATIAQAGRMRDVPAEVVLSQLDPPEVWPDEAPTPDTIPDTWTAELPRRGAHDHLRLHADDDWMVVLNGIMRGWAGRLMGGRVVLWRERTCGAFLVEELPFPARGLEDRVRPVVAVSRDAVDTLQPIATPWRRRPVLLPFAAWLDADEAADVLHALSRGETLDNDSALGWAQLEWAEREL